MYALFELPHDFKTPTQGLLISAIAVGLIGWTLKRLFHQIDEVIVRFTSLVVEIEGLKSEMRSIKEGFQRAEEVRDLDRVRIAEVTALVHRVEGRVFRTE